jgi:hypothetical protein
MKFTGDDSVFSYFLAQRNYWITLKNKK